MSVVLTTHMQITAVERMLRQRARSVCADARMQVQLCNEKFKAVAQQRQVSNPLHHFEHSIARSAGLS
jgi:hypothetical protein